MAFYTEFTNLTTNLPVSSAAEFSSASVGTRFKRIDGMIYIKNSSGNFEKDESVPNLKIYDVNDVQIFP